jgi:hypothetical protein
MEQVEFNLGIYDRIPTRKIFLVPTCVGAVGVFGYQYLPPALLDWGAFIYILALAFNGFRFYKSRKKIGEVFNHNDCIRFHIENRYYDIKKEDLVHFHGKRSGGTLRPFWEIQYNSDRGDHFILTASQVDLGTLLGYFRKIFGETISSETIWAPAHLFKY